MHENKGYNKKMYSKLMLNILKVMGGSFFIYIPLETYFKEVSIEVSMCALTKETSQKAS